MNKVLSQAIRKAVSNFSPETKDYSKDKNDLMLSVIIIIKINPEFKNALTTFLGLIDNKITNTKNKLVE